LLKLEERDGIRGVVSR